MNTTRYICLDDLCRITSVHYTLNNALSMKAEHVCLVKGLAEIKNYEYDLPSYFFVMDNITNDIDCHNMYNLDFTLIHRRKCTGTAQHESCYMVLHLYSKSLEEE